MKSLYYNGFIFLIFLGLNCFPKHSTEQVIEEWEWEAPTSLNLQYYGMMCPCPQWATPADISKYESNVGTNTEIEMDSLFLIILPEDEQLPNPFELKYNEMKPVFYFTGRFSKNRHPWTSETGTIYYCRYFKYNNVSSIH